MSPRTWPFVKGHLTRYICGPSLVTFSSYHILAQYIVYIIITSMDILMYQILWVFLLRIRTLFVTYIQSPNKPLEVLNLLWVNHRSQPSDTVLFQECSWCCRPTTIHTIKGKKQWPLAKVKTTLSTMKKHFTPTSNCLVGGGEPLPQKPYHISYCQGSPVL